jgi:hypothetical protein
MIRDEETLRRFEEDLIKREPQPTFREALPLFDAMWQEGGTLGVLPLSDPLDGIAVDIELARLLNCFFGPPFFTNIWLCLLFQ